MIPIKLPLLFAGRTPAAACFSGAHLALSCIFRKNALERDALPVVYLAATYLQWLFFLFLASWRTKKTRPIIMHLPHLLSFLPLIRHIMIAADRGQGMGLSTAQDLTQGADRAADATA
ncbi:MAG: hypothetical protein U1F27_02300 [Turneriella sp.]